MGFNSYNTIHTNAVEFKENSVVAPVILAQEGVLVYIQNDGVSNQYLSKAELGSKEFIDTCNGAPFTDDHPEERTVNSDNYSQHIRGSIYDVRQVNNRLMGKVKILDRGVIEKIRNNEKVEVSIGYACRVEKQNGIFGGKKYDAVQKNLRLNHLALVDRGRNGPDVKVLNNSQVVDNDFVIKLNSEEKDMSLETKVNKLAERLEMLINEKDDKYKEVEQEKRKERDAEEGAEEGVSRSREDRETAKKRQKDETQTNTQDMINSAIEAYKREQDGKIELNSAIAQAREMNVTLNSEPVLEEVYDAIIANSILASDAHTLTSLAEKKGAVKMIYSDFKSNKKEVSKGSSFNEPPIFSYNRNYEPSTVNNSVEFNFDGLDTMFNEVQ